MARVAKALTRVRLKFCTIEKTAEGCLSVFDDGTSVPSIPHPDDPHYHVVAHRLGYGEGHTLDVLHRYCYEHDFVHHFVAEYLFDAPSPSLWGVAHNDPVPEHHAACEEAIVMTFQRWLRANEQPIIAGVDWHAMKAAALRLIEGEKKGRTEVRP